MYFHNNQGDLFCLEVDAFTYKYTNVNLCIYLYIFIIELLKNETDLDLFLSFIAYLFKSKLFSYQFSINESNINISNSAFDI